MIKDKGAIAMAKALESNTTLLKVKMGNNQITDEGALELAKRLINNKTLKKIVLGISK